MGNQNSCGLFDDNRKGQDYFWVDGLSEQENLTIRDVYKSMGISCKYRFLSNEIRNVPVNEGV